ncbi:hypothetical protein GCM10010172_34610 [Paractinoplanes ferrugineus]|uniref:Uridine kinase n=1 Tax=Paractinoplanes ferrugineus TaxID=113564 RepID=A0A919MD63_9ACTN|nr:uridylate kinase [Actinoplanes ferrugineus]GIE15466.1 hypothetical protein Afe05nite_73060 [Actinoplanes ferrugineus]
MEQLDETGRHVAAGDRGELLDRLIGLIEAVRPGHPVRVAVDGPPAAGKTMLADELAAILRARGRAVIRACVDYFMFPREVRYRRGKSSPEACYQDSFDYPALRRVLLEPLGPGGDRHYRNAVYDWDNDAPLSGPAVLAPADAVLLLDGVFLQRPELAGQWDLSILVMSAAERLMERARVRDLARLATVTEVERRFRIRYLPAQEMYFAEAGPAENADVVVYNDDVQRPHWAVRVP